MTIFYVGDDAECKKFLARIPLIPINLVVTNREEDIVLQIKRAQPDVIFCDLSSQRSGGRDLLIRLRTEPETSLSMIIADLGSVEIVGHGEIKGTDVPGPDAAVSRPYDFFYIQKIIEAIAASAQ